MDNTRLVISPSPHVTSPVTVKSMMYGVVLSLIPAIIAGVWVFGSSALILIVVTTVAAMVFEAAWLKLRGKTITIDDGSAIITGLLLALNLPPSFPLWMAVIGAFIAIIIGKQIYGGLGRNPFNPALVGRVFLVIAFPVHMTTWILDGVTTATPLGLAKFEGIFTSYSDLFFGCIGGCIGETSALAILIGGLYLIYKQYIDWRIPVGYIGTVAVLSAVFGQDPLFHVLSGGLLLGAFFMATDLVTTPITKRGKWIFAIGAGVIVVIIRLFGGYPEGVSFSILIMNAVTPLINRYTRPRKFGEVKNGARVH
jgi:electron transport complex protein RnfD